MAKPPLNYTTRVTVPKTVAECSGILADGGASAVATMFEASKAVGLSFSLRTPHGPRTFVLPVNIDGVHAALKNADYPTSVRTADLARYVTREHAARVAWRIVKDWLEAQLAIIDAQMASMQEVMLPYLQIEGRTVWERYQESEQLAIGTGHG